MGFLDKLLRSLGGGAQQKPAGDPYGLWFYFRCKKCGSPVRVRIDRRNDVNREDGPGVFVLRKEVMDNKCFQILKAEIWLDETYNVVQANVSGGQLISKEDYEAAQSNAT